MPSSAFLSFPVQTVEKAPQCEFEGRTPEVRPLEAGSSLYLESYSMRYMLSLAQGNFLFHTHRFIYLLLITQEMLPDKEINWVRSVLRSKPISSPREEEPYVI